MSSSPVKHGNRSIGRPRAIPVCAQSLVIGTICAGDLASTLWLCSSHGAGEGNPLMAYFYAQGPSAFIAAKAAFTILPLTLLESVRRTRPRLGTLALNTVLFCYVAFYLVGVARVNTVKPDNSPSARKLDRDIAAIWKENSRRIAQKRRRQTVGLELTMPGRSQLNPSPGRIGRTSGPKNP